MAHAGQEIALRLARAAQGLDRLREADRQLLLFGQHGPSLHERGDVARQDREQGRIVGAEEPGVGRQEHEGCGPARSRRDGDGGREARGGAGEEITPNGIAGARACRSRCRVGRVDHPGFEAVSRGRGDASAVGCGDEDGGGRGTQGLRGARQARPQGRLGFGGRGVGETLHEGEGGVRLPGPAQPGRRQEGHQVPERGHERHELGHRGRRPGRATERPGAGGEDGAGEGGGGEGRHAQARP